MTTERSEQSSTPNGLLEGAAGRWTLFPGASSVEFRVRHLWGAITVRGRFEEFAGEFVVHPTGDVAGSLVINAASLNTKNHRRDEHLRSADFFDVERHPQIVVTVSEATLTHAMTLTCRGTLEAAGHVVPVQFSARIDRAFEYTAKLRAELVVDRTSFAMTWSPLRMASNKARARVDAFFLRSDPGTTATGT